MRGSLAVDTPLRSKRASLDRHVRQKWSRCCTSVTALVIAVEVGEPAGVDTEVRAVLRVVFDSGGRTNIDTSPERDG